MTSGGSLRILALAGGVGGARLAAGLARLLGERLTVLVNTGDDFEHLGLHISPDIDTVMYTLAGLGNPETGWGIAGESWTFMDQVARLGGPTWFRLGDRDLATHAIRTQRLRGGESLTAITADLCRTLGIRAAVLPMTDGRVRTIVHSEGKTLSFQDYFVRLKCAPPVTRLSFEGAADAVFNPALRQLEQSPERVAAIICPSNPYLSVDPILALPGFVPWMRQVAAVTIAISPIIGGAAVKGPAAKIMDELGLPPSAETVARHYAGLIDGFVFDTIDAEILGRVADLKIVPRTTDTMMKGMNESVDLAARCLDFVEELMRRCT